MHICEFFSQFVWMLIFCSMLFVSVAFIISSRIYKKIYPGIKLNSNEVVLMPFRFVWPNPKSRFKVFIPIWLCKFTFYHNVLFIGHHVLLLLIVSQSSDWSSCPLIGHHVLWLVINVFWLVINVLWLFKMSSDWSSCLVYYILWKWDRQKDMISHMTIVFMWHSTNPI